MAPKRSFFAPEVVQTSAMDCGPASLKCLLEGFGVGVGYDRLREACQTDVDGTSIDTMDEVANQLGVESEQIMVPPDHLFVTQANALPAILVVANPIGVTHFIVVWRTHGRWVQVMDPAIGRHWVRRSALLQKVYRHRMVVPADGWREWTRGEEFSETLGARMAALGLDAATRRDMLARVSSDADWKPIAALDAAVRMAAALVDSGGLPTGRSAATLVDNMLQEELARDEPATDEATGSDADGEAAEPAIPELYWSVRPAPRGEDGSVQLWLQGAVLVRVKGRHAKPTDATREAEGPGAAPEALPAELAAALSEPEIRPMRELWRTLATDGLMGPLVFVAALGTAAAATVIQVLFFRGLLDIGVKLVLPEQRLVAAAALGLFLLLVVLIEIPTAAAVLRFGRRLEVRLRRRFLEKTAQLADRYFRSRLASDMAERSHSTHALHEVPEIAGAFLRLVFQALLTTAGIIWLDPGVTLLALIALVLTLGLPVAAQPFLTETDLRVRNHAGALSRFYLDALLGLVPARNHGAERPMRREHENLLLEWNQALLRSERAKLWMSSLHSLTGYSLAILLVFRHLDGSEGVGQILLLAYWALSLQVIGEGLTVVARQIPTYRNITRRLLEPLGIAADEQRDRPVAEASSTHRESEADDTGRVGVEVRLQGVQVVAGGHQVLGGVDLDVAAGEHIAVVGPSGAGKSSLVGLLLGWHEAAAGRVQADGVDLDAQSLARLRHTTAWVDPAIQLWNRPLLTNLRYGTRGEADGRIGAAIDTALLRGLLEKLPQGMQTPLGESGALVSGGEGQRVRLARALLRQDARLVVLDEPFRGLDRSQRRELTERARRWWRSSTVFYISHDLAETQAFDRVLVIEGGRISESGRPADLKADSASRYASLLAAEAAVRRELEHGAAWRRWRVADGRVWEAETGGSDGP